jgi:VanZ family protein
VLRLPLDSPWRRLGRVAFWVALVGVVALALLPGNDTPAFPWSDKVNHFGAFAVLTGLARFAYPGRRGWTILAAMLGVGVGIELLQALPVIGRDAEIGDVVADLSGAFTVLVLHRLMRGRRQA